MSSQPPLPSPLKEDVEVQVAPAGFEGDVLCAIWRTLKAGHGMQGLESTVPANVYACLNIIATGEVRLDHAVGRRLPQVFVTGPLQSPLRTFSLAPLQSLSIVLQPWALPKWFDLITSSATDTLIYGDRIERLKDPRLSELLLHATTDAEYLVPALRALASNPSAEDEAPMLAEMLLNTGSVALAAERLGVGIRQYERRFKLGFGITPREWLQMKRFERSLVNLAQEAASLTDASAHAGYSDQSHMTRIYRRVTNQTPAQAKSAMDSDAPGFWAFRPAKISPK